MNVDHILGLKNALAKGHEIWYQDTPGHLLRVEEIGEGRLGSGTPWVFERNYWYARMAEDLSGHYDGDNKLSLGEIDGDVSVALFVTVTTKPFFSGGGYT
jgi:hypothetical protein